MNENKIQVVNVGHDILSAHDNIVKDCELMLPKRSKTTSINVCFLNDCITSVCNFILNGIEDFQIIIWKGRENES